MECPPDWIEDRNGNKIAISANGTITDALGRAALSSSGFGTTGSTVSVSGLSNPYQLTWTSITPSFSLSAPVVWQLSTSPGTCTPIVQGTSSPYPEVTKITLPNGQSYQLFYDTSSNTGLLNKIIYPGGGYVRYVWGANRGYEVMTYASSQDPYNGSDCQAKYDTLAVQHRYVSFDGVHEVEQQDFTYSPPTWATNTDGSQRWTGKQTTVVTTDLVTNQSFKTVYKYNPSYVPVQPNEPRYLGSSSVPVETEVDYFKDTTSSSPLKTVAKNYLDAQLPPVSETVTLDNGEVSQLTRSYTSLWSSFWPQSALMSGQPDGSGVFPCVFQISCLFVMTDMSEYDYGTPSHGGLIKQIHTDFSTFAHNPLFLSPYSSVPSPPIIVDRPSDIITCSSSPCSSTTSNHVAETDYSFDGAPIISVTSSNHDETNYAAGSTTPRGNATTRTVKCLVVTGSTTTTCPNIVNNYTFYETGQVATASDAKLTNVTQYSYVDNFDTPPSTNTNAYLTTLTQPNTGSISHTETFQYAFSDGQVLKSTDQNHNPTSYVYNDSLRRLTEVDYPPSPGGGQTLYFYNDTISYYSPYIERKEKIDASGDQTDFYTQFDGFGNVMRTAKANGVAGWEQADTCYDGLGRVLFVSYPYQGPGFTSDSHLCSNSQRAGDTFAYDALSRGTQVTHTDGSVASSTYTGRAVLSQDEGNGSKSVQRISQSNALGSLTSVCEITNATLIGGGGSPALCGLDVNPTAAMGFLTSYSYDPLGNLVGVTQGSTTRAFQYDSLSRLLQTTNPESGVTNYYYLLSGGGFCSGLASDICRKTDARGTTITYAYGDALSRLTGKAYSDSTPAATINYDETSARGVALTNTIGRKSSASRSGTYPTGQVFSYDTMGRVLNNSQCTPQNCGTGVFPISYQYDQLGNKISATNGAGATVTYGYNVASQLTTMTGSAPFPSTLLSNVLYNPFGEQTAVPFGNTVTGSFSYDSRGRLTNRADTTPTAVPGVAPTGSVTVNGTEQSVALPATQSTGSLGFSGSERSMHWCPPAGSCFTLYDSGNIKITVNGHTTSSTYGGSCGSTVNNDTSSIVASRVAAAINGDTAAFVTAVAGGSGITLTSKASGASSNYSVSATSVTNCTPVGSFAPGSTSFPVSASSPMTGGKNASTVYDAGSIWVQVGNFKVQVSYNQASTPASLASALATGPSTGNSTSGFGTASSPVSGSPVNATVNGSTVVLTAKQTNSSYSLSGGQSTSQGAYFSQPSFSVGSSGANLLNIVYSFGLAYTGNNDVQIGNDSVNGNWTYGYDDFNHLSTAVSSNTGQGCGWSYDRFGNRLQQNTYSGTCFTFSYSSSGNNNRMDGSSYDAAGNLLNDGHHSYAYDAESRITTIDGGSTASYVYDADGLRVRKSTGSTVVDFLYDLGRHEISELSSTGSLNRSELYADGQHIATYKGGTTPGTYFVHRDWLGTERLRSLATGLPCETIASLPFGDGQNISYSNGCTSDTSPLHFTGKEGDTESGLNYFGVRYGNAAMGRFMHPDEPFADQDTSDPQSWNMYSFVRNNPVANTDPSGAACVATSDNPSHPEWHDDDGPGESCADIDKKNQPSNLSNAPPDAQVNDTVQSPDLAGSGGSSWSYQWARLANGDRALGPGGRDELKQFCAGSIVPQMCYDFWSHFGPGWGDSPFNQPVVAGTTRPSIVPKNWIEKPTSKGNGRIYIDPKNPHNRVRVMNDGYMKVQKNGQCCDANGNAVPSSSPEAHIPVDTPMESPFIVE